MRLKSLHIENFRSINKLDIELPQVCGIVGPNNAGKTNLLEAIKRVLGYDFQNAIVLAILRAFEETKKSGASRREEEDDAEIRI